MNILELLEYEEGFRDAPYYCSLGYPTIGIGKRIGAKNTPLSVFEFTVNKAVAYEWLKCEVEKIETELLKYDWFTTLDSNRATIIISMSYQLGVNGMLDFKRMIAAIINENYEQAAREAMNSKWQKQTPARAKRHANVLMTGSFDGYR